MIGRIRALMRTPFARPKRGGPLRRFAPELCAGVLCIVYGIAFLLSRNPGKISTGLALTDAAAATYAAAGLLLLVMPIGLAANAITHEYERGTMDALRMTPLDRRRLVWARFGHLVAPWLRLMLYLIPIYGIMASSGVLRRQIREVLSGTWDWSLFPATAFLPKPVAAFGLRLFGRLEGAPGPEFGELVLNLWGSLLMALRAVNDLSILLLVTAGAFHISARVRSTARALVLSYLVVPTALATVLAFDVWWQILREEIPARTYPWLAPAAMLVRFALAFFLVDRVARNFDRYLSRE